MSSRATYQKKKENGYRYVSFGLFKPANEIVVLRGNILLYTVGKSCKRKWLAAGLLVTCHQTFFNFCGCHALVVTPQVFPTKLLIFQDSRICCSRIFEAKISRNLLKQFKKFGERFEFDRKVAFWMCSNFWSSNLSTREWYGGEHSKR